MQPRQQPQSNDKPAVRVTDQDNGDLTECINILQKTLEAEIETHSKSNPNGSFMYNLSVDQAARILHEGQKDLFEKALGFGEYDLVIDPQVEENDKHSSSNGPHTPPSSARYFSLVEKKPPGGYIKQLYAASSLCDTTALRMKSEANKEFMKGISLLQSHPSHPADTSTPSKVISIPHNARISLEISISRYTEAMAKVHSDTILAELLCNRSIALYNLQRYRDSCLDANYALLLRNTYWKALRKRGECLVRLGFIEMGEEDVTTAGREADNDKFAYTDEEAEVQKMRCEKVRILLHSKEDPEHPSVYGPPFALSVPSKLVVFERSPQQSVASSSETTSYSVTPFINHPNDLFKVERDAKGRYIVATKRLEKGTPILVETPYAVSPKIGGLFTSCAFCLRRTSMLYPSDKYRTCASPTYVPPHIVDAIEKCLEGGMEVKLVDEKSSPNGNDLINSIIHKVCRSGDRSVGGGSVSRGLFCGPECADQCWLQYGQREVINPYYLVCPVDSLLASRMLFTDQKGIQLMRCVEERQVCSSEDMKETKEKNPNDENESEELPARSESKAPIPLLSIDSKSCDNNTFGRAYMDTLCAFSKELCAAGVDAVGGKETVLTVLGCHFKVIDANSTPVVAEKYRKMHRQILTNSHSISCMDRVTSSVEGLNMQNQHQLINVNVGKAMYSIASLFNHSCDPNCVVSFRGNPHGASAQLHIRLVRTAMEGEELSISYGGVDKYHVHSTRARIRSLRASHGFSCSCTACYNIVDEGVKKEDEVHYHKAADMYQKGRRLTREGKLDDAIQVLFQSYDIVMRFICPPPRPPQLMMPKTHDALAHAYLLQGNREKSVEHLKAALALSLQLHDSLLITTVPVPSVAVADRPELCDEVSIPITTTGVMSTDILASPDSKGYLDIGSNTGIVQEYIRLAFLLSGMSPGDGTGAHRKESNAERVHDVYVKDARAFARKAIELMTVYYPPSVELEGEVLQLEMI